MSDFERSGHARRWIFSEEGLAQRREAVVKQAGSPLSAAEEVLLVRFYAEQTLALCRAQRLPDRVADTAALFLQRLYTRVSLYRRDAKVSLAACIVLAAKTEEHWAPSFADRLCADLRVDAGRVLVFEAALLAELCFDVRVFLPRRAIAGLAARVPRYAALADDASAEVLRAATVSDAMLLHTPAQVALAALHLAAIRQQQQQQQQSVEQFLTDSALLAAGATDVRNTALIAAVTHAESLIVAVLNTPPSREQLADIDRRLKAALMQ